MNYLKLVEIAKSDWESSPELAIACEKFIVAAHKTKPSKLQHMTFSGIRDLISMDLNPDDIVRITQYLCGERVNLLEAGFEYISDDEEFILDKDNCHYAFSENAIAHPITGRIIHNVKKDVYMFFNLLEGNLSER